MSNIVLAAGGDDGYQISRSVRVRASASAYLERVLPASGNTSNWTWSGWIKRARQGTSDLIFGTFGVGGAYEALTFEGDSIRFFQYSGAAFACNKYSTAVFRDPSAWYHIVCTREIGAAAAEDRLRVYVNGVRITSWSTNTLLSGQASYVNNSTYPLRLGATSGGLQLDGYLTEVNFIDGQALLPTSFGETDSITGAWKAKAYSGSRGTNGFYLNFSDPSAATAAAIGKDSSGNGNNWTPNNISVTAGVTYDSMLDVPTMYADGGSGRGNYAVLSPITGSVTGVVDGNLTLNYNAAGSNIATIGASSGKWYYEGKVNAQVVNQQLFGIANSSFTLSNFVGQDANSWSICVQGNASNGQAFNNNVSTSSYATFANGDIAMIAFDVDAGKVWFGRNGTWFNSGAPDSGTGAIYTNLTAGPIFPAATNKNTTGAVLNVNFGQRPFAYTPPTGFKALNTQNLPESTIKKGNQYFDATTYTGNGGTQSIVNAGGFQPDLVWLKPRAAAVSHSLFDSLRGAYVSLGSDITNAEANNSPYGLSAFNSNGFTLVDVANGGYRVNGSPGGAFSGASAAYVGWQWKESVSAGFDIVTYTGTGVNRTIAHSLGVAPKMIIAKHTNAVDNWIVYHASLGGSPDYLWLNLTSAKGTSSAVWNTAPTSSVFGVGTDNLTNISGGTYVAYLFSEVAGFSKFGSYTGNGSADGPFVYCGFRPKFVLVKCTSNPGEWYMLDTSRSQYNVANGYLIANQSAAEATGAVLHDFLSNGFKVRDTVGSWNTSGYTYIYAAFAENPFKNSLAR